MADAVVLRLTALSILSYTLDGGWRMTDVHCSNPWKIEKNGSPARRTRGASISEDINTSVYGEKGVMTGCHTLPTEALRVVRNPPTDLESCTVVVSPVIARSKFVCGT